MQNFLNGSNKSVGSIWIKDMKEKKESLTKWDTELYHLYTIFVTFPPNPYILSK